MRLKYKKLGEFIRLIDERNSDGLFSEDELYGKMLLNYINNKDIKDIQLNKREFEYEK